MEISVGPILLRNPHSYGCSARLEGLRGGSYAATVLASHSRHGNFEFLPTDSDF